MPAEYRIRVVIDPAEARTGGDAAKHVLKDVDSAAEHAKASVKSLGTELKSIDTQLREMKQKAGTAVEGGKGALVDQLERQSSLFKSIRGPVLDYRQDIQALQGLYQRGSITAQEFAHKHNELTANLHGTSGGAR